MTSLSSFATFLLLILLLATTTTTIVTTTCGGTLIHRTCKNTSATDENISYNFCITALLAAPASRCANLTRLGLMSINLARDTAIDTRCLVRQILESKKLDKKVKSVAKDCLEMYSDTVATLKEAIRDYKGKRFVDVNVKVGSAIDAASSCEDGFKEIGVKSPLTKPNNHTFQLSAIALSIMHMVSIA